MTSGEPEEQWRGTDDYARYPNSIHALHKGVINRTDYVRTVELLVALIQKLDATEVNKELMQLEMFVAVVEERSFLRAAERVFRTQPAISIGIRKLERELVFLCRIVRIGGVGG